MPLLLGVYDFTLGVPPSPPTGVSAYIMPLLLGVYDFTAGLPSSPPTGVSAYTAGLLCRRCWASTTSPPACLRRRRLVSSPIRLVGRLPTAAGDLHPGAALAPLWVRDLPDDAELVIQARVALDVPPEGDLGGFVQAGLAVLGQDDTAYLKLVHVAMHATRQTEFGIEVAPAEAQAPRYGSTVGGPPGDWTELCLRLRRQGARVVATAYTRADAGAWVAGGTWVHEGLGDRLRLALLAMGGAGHQARFDHVRVWRATVPPAWK